MKILKTEEKNNKKEISKEIDKKISNKVFINLLVAILIMAYFCGMSIVYRNIQLNSIIDIVKVATLVFLALTLVLIEIAYKKESKRVFIHSMEALFLAAHSLTTMHVIKLYNFDFQNYILISSYVFSVYYVLKAIIINTKARSDYLKSLSDISEIVQKDEPTKKEASKKEKVEPAEDYAKIIKEEIKNQSQNKIENTEKEENKKENNEKQIKQEKKKNENKEKKNIDKQIEESKSKIASIKAKLEKIQNKQSNTTETIDTENKEKIEENKIEEESKAEEQETPKPKRKRGRTKNEVKIDD